ncbi:Ferulate 5-hydroxylase [Thalictrum thalictroides]|uniref:Ferulate 5-hydroxylase n=1 Tax=Thalictrum thalictroides TaxID=46969 RepID=A0A7J6V0P2_THATH|nr:Ferulate 5-hydroxylase [Thalictrum thalictroides]
MRKLCVMKLFSRKRAASWVSVRDEIETTIQAIASKASSPINYFPFLSWIDPQGFTKKLAKARNSLDKFIIDNVIDHHKEKKNNNKNTGMDEMNDTDMVDDLHFYSSERTEEKTTDELQSSISITRSR